MTRRREGVERADEMPVEEPAIHLTLLDAALLVLINLVGGLVAGVCIGLFCCLMRRLNREGT